MRPAALALLALALQALAAAGAAERAPVFPKGTAYGQARRSLLALGWSPVRLPDADECAKDDKRCEGRPEMSSCSGTGLARCLFIWRKGEASWALRALQAELAAVPAA